MRFRSGHRESPDINLTPLIDVVFLLLIFFMVSTTFERASELAIELPRSTADTKPETEAVIEIGVDAEGRFYLNGRQLVNTQLATVREAMREAAGEEASPPVVVNADAAAPYQAVVTVMDAARQLGFGRLRFPTRHHEERP